MAVVKDFNLPEKTVKLFGHLDDDYFRVYTESLESRSDLSVREKEIIKDMIDRDPKMILD